MNSARITHPLQFRNFEFSRQFLVYINSISWRIALGRLWCSTCQHGDSEVHHTLTYMLFKSTLITWFSLGDFLELIGSGGEQTMNCLIESIRALFTFKDLNLRFEKKRDCAFWITFSSFTGWDEKYFKWGIKNLKKEGETQLMDTIFDDIINRMKILCTFEIKIILKSRSNYSCRLNIW